MNARTLRDRRKALDLSQQRLAELAECSMSIVRMFENGYRPTQESEALARIEKVLEREEGKKK